jgi:hypothetical protein
MTLVYYLRSVSILHDLALVRLRHQTASQVPVECAVARSLPHATPRSVSVAAPRAGVASRQQEIARSDCDDAQLPRGAGLQKMGQQTSSYTRAAAWDATAAIAPRDSRP